LCVWYSVLCVWYSVLCVWYSVLCVWYSVLCVWYSVLCVWYGVLCVWYSVLCVWYSVLCVWYSVLCVWYSVLCVWYSVLCVWYSVLYMHQAEKCVPYASLYLQDCLHIFMSMIYRNNRCVCVWCFCVVCVCVCVFVGLRTLCDVTYRNIWHRTVHLIPEQVTCFGMSKLLVVIPSFFRVFLSYFAIFFCPSCSILQHPSNPPPPPTTDFWTAYLQLPFIMMTIRYSDNWA